jgi:hypothetical protein
VAGDNSTIGPSRLPLTGGLIRPALTALPLRNPSSTVSSTLSWTARARTSTTPTRSTMTCQSRPVGPDTVGPDTSCKLSIRHQEAPATPALGRPLPPAFGPAVRPDRSETPPRWRSEVLPSVSTAFRFRPSDVAGLGGSPCPTGGQVMPSVPALLVKPPWVGTGSANLRGCVISGFAPCVRYVGEPQRAGVAVAGRRAGQPCLRATEGAAFGWRVSKSG